jgi:hypothetical protein
LFLEPFVPAMGTATNSNSARCHAGNSKGTSMKKAALIIATIATLGATAITAPAEARGGRGFGGAGIGLGIAAGALAAGAAYGAYGPGYGYGYGPRYYAPRYAYGDGYYYRRGPRYYNRYGYY